MTNDLSTQLDRVGRRLSRIKSQTFHKLLLGGLGQKSTIRRPIVLRGASNIFIGDNTWIRDGGRLEAIHRSGESAPRLHIGNRVLIEQNVHIVCSSSVVIEDDVVIAAGSTIIDTFHPTPDEVTDHAQCRCRRAAEYHDREEVPYRRQLRCYARHPRRIRSGWLACARPPNPRHLKRHSTCTPTRRSP
jgi:hypothetical protein